MKERLFIGIPMLPRFQDACVGYARLLSRSRRYRFQSIRWTEAKNLHLTLCFLGEYDAGLRRGIAETLGGIAQKHQPFSLQFSRVALGPPGKKLRMVWGIFSDHTAYTRLSKDIANALEKNLKESTGRAIKLFEDRPVVPHVTLARFVSIQNPSGLSLPQPDGMPQELAIHSFVLFQSMLRSTGALYTPLQIFPFGIDL